MNRTSAKIAGLVLAAMAVTLSARAAAEEDLTNPTTELANVGVKIVTNKMGGLSKALIKTRYSNYEISLKDLAPAVLQSLPRLDDHRVTLHGDISKTGDVTSVKVIGPIKDVTPTLTGGMLRCVPGTKGEYVGATYRVGVDTFEISTNGMSEANLKILLPWGGERLADLDGRLSIWDNKIYDLRGIRAKAAAAPVKKPAALAKKPGK